ncbi:tRNA pseudouridine(55) synthase TruB, partial [candidate division KSB1 bacterium]
IELGKVTDTLDIEGRVISQQPVKHFSEIEIAAVCEEFVGESEQIPPLFSAIKYRGKKLYQLARRGEMVQPQPRKITIYELRLVEVNLPKIVVEVTCSKGTYIRALARDIGEKLGVGGYLRSLTRTRVGTFHISESLNLTEFLTLKQA